MNRRKFVVGSVAAVAALGLTSCVGYRPGHGGPPPHAPAHGYRRKHPAGVDLVYDAGLGVYLVPGYPYYYLDDRFYRTHSGVWQVSVSLNGPWQAIGNHSVPPGLQKRGGRGRGRPPGRGGGPPGHRGGPPGLRGGPPGRGWRI